MIIVMEMIDTLCHLDFEAFDADRQQVLLEARTAGLSGIIVPATHREGWHNLLAVCADDDSLHSALGLHPMFLHQHRESDLVELEQTIDQLTIKQTNLVAIGEIGLDFRNPDLNQKQQHFYFEQQLNIASKKKLPVILHILKAHDQAIAVLKQHSVSGGTVHAFNGNSQQAKQYIDLGFKLGFGSMLTYERSSKLRKLATHIPLEAIVLETDAPDMTVSQYPFQRGSPANLVYCCESLAELRKLTAEDVAAQTTANARPVFKFRNCSQ